MKNCPKWNCQQPVQRTVLRHCQSAVSATTVVRLCCPRCGWQHEDYEVVKLPGKAMPHQRDKAMARARKQREAVRQ